MMTSYGVSVAIWRVAESADAAGFPSHSYTLSSTVTMFMQPRTGREGIQYGRDTAERFVMFYAPVGTDVLETDRLVYDSRVFDVQSIRQPGQFGAATTTGHLAVETVERKGEPVPS